jgi:predicted PurR-regulated permease PerM
MADEADLGRAGRPLRHTPFRFGLLAGFGALLAFVALLAVRHLASILAVLVAAAFFTIGLDRPVRLLTRRGLARGWAVTVVIVLLSLLVIGALALLLPKLVAQTSAFFAALPAYLRDLLPEGDSGLAAKFGAFLTPQNVAAVAGGLLGGAASLASAVFLGITTLMVTLFLLAAFEQVKTGAYRWVAASRRDRARKLGDAMMDKVGAYLAGAVTIAVCAATAALLWCLATGIPYPLMLALIVGIADMIPQVGATLGSIIVTLTALTVSLTLALLTLGFFIAYQGLENWVVYPRLMSRAVKISNLAAIVSALIGGALMGVLGVLLAVPVYASMQLLVREVVFPRQETL